MSFIYFVIFCDSMHTDYQPAPFSEKFFLVVIEKDLNGNSVLQMWHLHLRSVQACIGTFQTHPALQQII